MTVTDPQEAEANQFAMELLMPADWLREDIKKLGGIDIEAGKDIAALAKRYKVSETLIAHRIGQLFNES